MKRIILIGAAVTAVLVAVGVKFLASNLNSLVASTIEKQGSRVTETSVNVSGVRISLRKGRGSISGLRIASPEGFEAGDAFVLGDITIDLDVAGVRRDPVVIDEIRIRKPVVNAEVGKNGKSNIDELRKRVQAYGGSGSTRENARAKRIRIKRFVLDEGEIAVDATALGIDRRTLNLSKMRLDNVGGENGAPPDQITKLIVAAVAKKTLTEIAESEVNRQIEKRLGESLPDKAKGLLDKIIP